MGFGFRQGRAVFKVVLNPPQTLLLLSLSVTTACTLVVPLSVQVHKDHVLPQKFTQISTILKSESQSQVPNSDGWLPPPPLAPPPETQPTQASSCTLSIISTLLSGNIISCIADGQDQARFTVAPILTIISTPVKYKTSGLCTPAGEESTVVRLKEHQCFFELLARSFVSSGS